MSTVYRVKDFLTALFGQYSATLKFKNKENVIL